MNRQTIIHTFKLFAHYCNITFAYYLCSKQTSTVPILSWVALKVSCLNAVFEKLLVMTDLILLLPSAPQFGKRFEIRESTLLCIPITYETVDRVCCYSSSPMALQNLLVETKTVNQL